MPLLRAGFPLNLGPRFLPPQLEELRDELDRVWNTITGGPLPGRGVGQTATAFPAVNVRETDDALTIEAELPGLDVGDVEISVTGDELVLKGTRAECDAAAGDGDGDGDGQPARPVTWHRRERGTGAFERRIALPMAVDAGRVAARLVNGVLTVTCPKAPQCQPHKVEVRAS
jgi:HSP20 family protein